MRSSSQIIINNMCSMCTTPTSLSSSRWLKRLYANKKFAWSKEWLQVAIASVSELSSLRRQWRLGRKKKPTWGPRASQKPAAPRRRSFDVVLPAHMLKVALFFFLFCGSGARKVGVCFLTYYAISSSRMRLFKHTHFPMSFPAFVEFFFCSFF